MATVELIAELHEIKESMCNAVRHVHSFTAVQQNTRITNHISYGQQVQFTAPVGPTWTTAGNVTQQLEHLVKLCGKGNAFDINVKKFELKEKIPNAEASILQRERIMLDETANCDKLKKVHMEYVSMIDNLMLFRSLQRVPNTAEYNKAADLCNATIPHYLSVDIRKFNPNHNPHIFNALIEESGQHESAYTQAQKKLDTNNTNLENGITFYEAQATILHTRLTALIDMIPMKNSNSDRVKKVYVKKVVVKELTQPAPVVTKISQPQQTPNQKPPMQKTPLTLSLLNPKTKTHQISLENYEIRALKQSDCLLQINNLSEFANVQFYFHKSQYNELYLHYKGHAQYLIGNDHKLYVINETRLVQGSHYDKLQCWTF